MEIEDLKNQYDTIRTKLRRHIVSLLDAYGSDEIAFKRPIKTVYEGIEPCLVSVTSMLWEDNYFTFVAIATVDGQASGKVFIEEEKEPQYFTVDFLLKICEIIKEQIL